ncbi:MAG: prepilin-type N-terminal cleavage/methylation domain-containing protein [Phycisphaerales bacterium JB039]
MYKRTRAFSLIELVIVVVILGIIAAIAAPRMSRGSKGAIDSALKSDLAVLRNAIELYQIEHDGLYPTELNFASQLEGFTSITGAFQSSKDATHYLGPYIASVPSLTVGPNKGASGVAAASGPGVGWIYNETTGTISANVPAGVADDRGVDYADY